MLNIFKWLLGNSPAPTQQVLEPRPSRHNVRIQQQARDFAEWRKRNS